MLEYQLQYRGKKSSFTTPPIIGNKYTFTSAPVWVLAGDADALMKINPSMFYKIAERDTENPVEEAADIKVKAELSVPETVLEVEETAPTYYACTKCGKEYTMERFYLMHIAKCTGPEDDK